jgi:hypothetical protein
LKSNGEECQMYYEDIEKLTGYVKDHQAFLFSKTQSVIKDGLVANS